MSYKLKYYSDFQTVENILCRLEIWEDTESIIQSEEVVIENNSIHLKMDDGGFFEQIHATSLDFSLISMENFQFHSLFSSGIFKHKVLLYKTGVLIFSGFIDSETYEEPYEQYDRYTVDVSCGNIKILNRIDYNSAGFATIGEIINDIFNQVGIFSTTWMVNKKMVSPSNTTYDLIDVVVNKERFYSDDDKITYYEVLEEVLKTFNLKVFIVNNYAYILDLRAYSSLTKYDLEEVGINSGVLGVADIYKSLQITFNPDANKELFDGSIDKSEISGKAYSSTTIKVDKVSTDDGYLTRNYGQIQLKNYLFPAGSTSYCVARNLPRFSGNDDIFISYLGGYGHSVNNTGSHSIGSTPVQLFSSTPFYTGISQSEDWRLRISLEMMISPKYNPFEEASKNNRYIIDEEVPNAKDNSANNAFNYYCNIIYVACNLVITGDDGFTYYYDNTNVRTNHSLRQSGIWVKATGSVPDGKFLLTYYKSREGDTPFSDQSWGINSQTIGNTVGRDKLPLRVERMKDKGTLVELPPVSGFLQITVFEGFDGVRDNGSTTFDWHNYIRMLWYKNLKIYITDSDNLSNSPDDEYVYKGILDIAAENDEKMDLMLGGVTDEDVTARGALRNEFGTIMYSVKNYTGDTTEQLEVKILRDFESIYSEKRNKITVNCKPVPIMSVIKSEFFKNGANNKLFAIFGFDYNVIENQMELNLYELPTF